MPLQNSIHPVKGENTADASSEPPAVGSAGGLGTAGAESVTAAAAFAADEELAAAAAEREPAAVAEPVMEQAASAVAVGYEPGAEPGASAAVADGEHEHADAVRGAG